MDFEEELIRFRRGRRRRLRVTSSLLTILALITVALLQAAPAEVKETVKEAIPSPIKEAVEQTTGDVLDAQPGLWNVSHVVDGDTIDVTMGEQKDTVRLLGVDTPETHDPRKPVQCFGEAAAAHARELMEGKNVRLEPDPTNSNRDKYQRLLRYVYLPDGTLVNEQIIRDGYGFAYTVFPLTKSDQFVAAQGEAREAGRGLWGGCNVDESKDIKQTTSSKQ